MTISTELDGLDDAMLYFETAPKIAARAARLAINDTISRKGLKVIQNEMLDQVNFPKGYLKGDRLGVVQYATESRLEGVIRARKRATSLARFAAPGTPLGSSARSGVRVSVRNGGSAFLRNAWLVRLRKGASLTEDQYNVGLAVRVKPGDKIDGKYSAHQSWLIPGTVALLYGPSVDQVFSDVAEDTGPEILDLLGKEFFRQFERLS